MCHSFLFSNVILPPISTRSLMPLLICLLLLLFFFPVVCLSVFCCVYPPLFLDPSPLIVIVSRPAIPAAESLLLFQTKSQCKDENTCRCRCLLISIFILPLFLSLLWFFIYFPHSLSDNIFLFMPLLSLWHSLHLSLSSPFFALNFSLACAALPGSWQLFAKQQNCLPFPNCVGKETTTASIKYIIYNMSLFEERE